MSVLIIEDAAVDRRSSGGGETKEGVPTDAEKVVEQPRPASAGVSYAFTNTSGAHVAIVNEAGTVIAVNAAWQRFGRENGLLDAASCIGANYLTVCEQATADPDGTARAVREGLREVLEGKSNAFELEYPCHAPHEERWFAVRATPLASPGPRRVVISHENITARRIADRLSREQQALREAVAGMEHVLGVVAHELRTPLAGLKAMSEFLITDGARDTAEADHFLNEIAREVNRMSETVNNLLEAARLNSGRARWNWSRVDLSHVIQEAAASVRMLLDPALVNLHTDADPDVGFISGDANAIRRLLLNLLSNSQKYTRKGDIHVEARRSTDAEGDWIELSVRDTGSGIKPEVVARLGEAFALNSGVVGTTHISGTGLGVAICKSIADAHGGYLIVDSVEGRGTCVTARIRADLPAAATGDTTFNPSGEEENT